MPSFIPRQFILGFLSPIHSARFLFQKKSLFLIGVAPQIINFILYFWVVNKFIIGKWLNPFLSSLEEKSNLSFIVTIFKPEFFQTLIWVLALLLYGILGASFVNAIASPVYDYIAKKSYESNSKKIIPYQTIGDTIDSIISEFTKAIFVFCVFIISLFFPVLSPLFFILGIWYLGWNSVDRTLLLLNLPLKERLKFGARNSAMCIGLGLWCYIPLLAPIIAFAIASAGATLVAKSNIPYFQDNSPGADF